LRLDSADAARIHSEQRLQGVHFAKMKISLYLTLALGLILALCAQSTFANDDFEYPAFSPSMTAHEAHRAAMTIVQRPNVNMRDIRESLKFFEHCVKLEPQVASYHNNLGVTLMRLSRFPEAHRSFLRSADLDRDAEDYQVNIRDLAQFWKNMPLDPITARLLGKTATHPPIDPWNGYPGLDGNPEVDPDDFDPDELQDRTRRQAPSKPAPRPTQASNRDPDDFDDDFDGTPTHTPTSTSTSNGVATAKQGGSGVTSRLLTGEADEPMYDNVPLRAIQLSDADVKTALDMLTRAHAINSGILETHVILDDDDDDFVAATMNSLRLDLSAHSQAAELARKTLLRAAQVGGGKQADMAAAVRRGLVNEFKQFLANKLIASVQKSLPPKPPRTKRSLPSPQSIDEESLSPIERRALRLSRVNTNPRSPFPRIHIRDLGKPENAIYLAGRLPYILVGALDVHTGGDVDAGNKERARLWTPEMFAAKFPDAVADFYPSNMDDVHVHPFLSPMSKAVAEFLHPSGDFPKNEIVPGTYIQFNVVDEHWQQLRQMVKIPPRFEEDLIWLESCLGNREMVNEFTKKLHWRMSLIGSQGAGMFNHQDVMRTSSWQAQLVGGKRWHICAPDQRVYLYGAGTVDCFHPDYEKYPLFKYARCWEDVVKAGEMVFYPRDYWHQTENVATPSISISASVLDAYSYKEIQGIIERECRFGTYRWNFSQELCKTLETKCFPMWENMYGGKFDSYVAENEAHHKAQLNYV